MVCSVFCILYAEDWMMFYLELRTEPQQWKNLNATMHDWLGIGEHDSFILRQQKRQVKSTLTPRGLMTAGTNIRYHYNNNQPGPYHASHQCRLNNYLNHILLRMDIHNQSQRRQYWFCETINHYAWELNVAYRLWLSSRYISRSNNIRLQAIKQYLNTTFNV